MTSVPPKRIEAVIGLLIPPACREEVLGDLYERYVGLPQYIFDAMRAVPLVILSRVRRTTDPAICLTEALALYFSFLVGSWYVNRALLAEQWGLWRLAIPVAVALSAMVLRDAYSVPGTRSRWEAVLRPLLGAACALLIALSWRTEPLWIVLGGGALSILLVSPLRILFPPSSDLPQVAGGPPFRQHPISDPLGLPAAIVAAVVLISLSGRPYRLEFLIWILVAVLFYARYKRS
jgi:hypothetical protein